ncbi:MAG: hypothetical protein K5846_09385 [Bacteroidales bacterium]|nr:hypothetical protein [Bacteroidales bacterium]
MKRGKRTCEFLKEVRQRVARENDIPLETRECTHKGDCRGTCPYCEAEVRYLEQELSKRRSLGKAVTVAGIAVSSMMMGGCHSSSPKLQETVEMPESTTDIEKIHDSSKATEQKDSIPHPGQIETYELDGFVEGIDEVTETKSNCPGPKDTTYKDFLDGDIALWEEPDGIIIDVSDDWERNEWHSSVGVPTQWLKSRLATPLDFLRNPKYDNTYIVLIINNNGEVKEVVFQPKNVLSSAQERAFQEEATRILKTMPKWEGGNTAASYEIPIRDLR